MWAQIKLEDIFNIHHRLFSVKGDWWYTLLSDVPPSSQCDNHGSRKTSWSFWSWSWAAKHARLEIWNKSKSWAQKRTIRESLIHIIVILTYSLWSTFYSIKTTKETLMLMCFVLGTQLQTTDHLSRRTKIGGGVLSLKLVQWRTRRRLMTLKRCSNVVIRHRCQAEL